MRKIPECLNRRYLALDDLIREISNAMSDHGSPLEAADESDNVGIKLMCDLWEILKENPDCNLTQEVEQRMRLRTQSSGLFAPRHVACYMAGSCCDDKKKPTKNSCGQDRSEQSQQSASKPANPRSPCCPKSSKTSTNSESMPLTKALCNLNEAATFEKKCNARITELMETQKNLKEQIQALESREKEGMQLLKQADCMWSCMEASYKKKVADSVERQSILMQQMKEVEKSSNKWRKNKKDLEFQLDNVQKCHQEIKEKINQKANDKKFLELDIENFKKRVESAKKDLQASKDSQSSKKAASDAKIAKIMAEITKLQKSVGAEDNYKQEKENEGAVCVKEAREELQKICKVLLKKKLENEDLSAERGALFEELEFIKQARDNCKEKCKNKQNNLSEEIKKIDKEIAGFKNQCVRCHQCTDTADARKLCTDCPRCLKQRECIVKGDHCDRDPVMDCVCVSVKHKFLDNVFDNMYTVLAKHAKTGAGKAIADNIVKCLKRSRNGKLDAQTRQILQEFILTTVKKNLNLTIIGGAVKTRCEMDTDTYNQLMLCLKYVKPTPPPKADKSTPAKKDPCGRWGGTSECNCPKGPKYCVCNRKAPPPVSDPKPCPPPVKEDEAAVISCPHQEKSVPCGADCAMHASSVGADVAAWKPDPCKGQSCPFSKSMRAAQCVLGPEPLSSIYKGKNTIQFVTGTDDVLTCDCGTVPMRPCPCSDRRCQPRQQIIDEVMGRYTEISPIQKVANVDTHNIPLKKKNKDKCKTEMYKEDKLSSKYNRENNLRKKTTNKLAGKEVTGIYEQQDNKKDFNNITENNALREEGKSFNVVKSRADLKVALCPQFTPFSKKSMKSFRTNEPSTFGKIHHSLKNKAKSNIRCACDSYDAKYVNRNVCNTVRELIKDVIKTNKVNQKKPDNIEWITAESLYKELEKLDHVECPSNETQSEIEINCEILEEPNNFVTSYFITYQSCTCAPFKTIPNQITKEDSKTENKTDKMAFKVSHDNITVNINCSGINIIQQISKPFDFMELPKLPSIDGSR